MAYMYQQKWFKKQNPTIYLTKDGERIDLKKLKNEGGRVVLGKGSKHNKYGAKSAVFKGISYHSTAEARYAQQLEFRKIGKEIKDWKRQHKISLDVNGHHITNYIVDFLITHLDGSIELVEVKGMVLETWAIKWKLLEAIYSKEHPDVILTVVKV